MEIHGPFKLAMTFPSNFIDYAHSQLQIQPESCLCQIQASVLITLLSRNRFVLNKFDETEFTILY